MFSIGEVAERTGVSASALRSYERKGLIPAAERQGGRRVYGDDIFDRLALIGVAKSAGFTVPEILTLLAGLARRTPPGVRWRTLTRRKLVELEARLAEVEQMRRALEAVTHCDRPSLEECSRAIRSEESPPSR